MCWSPQQGWTSPLACPDSRSLVLALGGNVLIVDHWDHPPRSLALQFVDNAGKVWADCMLRLMRRRELTDDLWGSRWSS